MNALRPGCRCSLTLEGGSADPLTSLRIHSWRNPVSCNTSSMKQGAVLIDPLRAYAEKLNWLAVSGGKSSDFQEYIKLVDDLLNRSIVPSEPGLYCWGVVKNKAWKSVYVGQTSGMRHAGLHSRLRKELITERVLFWADKTPWETIDDLGSREHCENNLWHRKYRKGTQRAIKKKECTHILWFSLQSESDVSSRFLRSVEACLIHELQPEANDPTITDSAKKRATEISGSFVKFLF